MEEQNNLPVKNKWKVRLAILFLVLFAFFWSLGPFFFWVLFSFAAYFVFLAFYSSDIKISMFEQRRTPENPYRGYKSPDGAIAPPPQILFVRKIIRVFVITLAAMFAFFFLIGVFFGKDEEEVTAEPVKMTSVPEEDNVFNTYSNKGIEFFNQAQYDSALKYYNKALLISPDEQYTLYNKALAYYMKEEYRRSISIVKKCLRKHPDYNEAWWLLGDDYFFSNNYDSAILCLEKAYNNNYSDPNFLQQMAETYLKKDNRGKAKEFYLKVIEQDTTKIEAYRKLAELDPGNANIYRKKVNMLEQSSK